MNTKKLLILSIALISYLAIGAEIFFRIEHNAGKPSGDLEMIWESLGRKYNISEADRRLLSQVLHSDAEHHFGETEWTYWSSLYFCGSVVTTIGYGHLAPRTPLGRIVCMIYASLGIPLNLWLIKILGEKIHNIISWMIRVFEEKVLGREVKNLKIKGFIMAVIINLITLILGGLMYKYSEKWTFLEGIYFCFIVYSTIGFGDLVPNEGRAPVNSHETTMMLLRAFNLLIGLALLSSLLASAMNAADDIRVVFPPFNSRIYPFKTSKSQDKVQEIQTKEPKTNTKCAASPVLDEEDKIPGQTGNLRAHPEYLQGPT